MTRKLIYLAARAALEQLGAEIRSSRDASFRRAWNHTEKKG